MHASGAMLLVSARKSLLDNRRLAIFSRACLEQSRRLAATSTLSHVAADGQELKVAREWLSNFNSNTLPRNIFQITYSRASGPGGQNVNKVNSKATLKVPLDSLLSHVPSVLHPQIRASRYCKEASNSIIIQADEHRKQNDNANSCLIKLHNMIREAGSEAVPGETTDAQKERVKGLQKAANEQRLKSKKQHTMKKSSRQGGGRSDEW